MGAITIKIDLALFMDAISRRQETLTDGRQATLTKMVYPSHGFARCCWDDDSVGCGVAGFVQDELRRPTAVEAVVDD